ncbi:Protein CHROMATIN REMODELING 20 [Paramyrothecium foliicola]|nr:Protein CHROMATIN REMODELING 20 [Paramyrothecium foliicola]
MEEPKESDPFGWDIEDVAKTLCVPGCGWTRDEKALEAKIRDEEIDGKTLLTFEHVCSRQELMECLGIKVARHKATLSETISNLRYKSPAYRFWLKDHKRKENELHEEGNTAANNASTTPPMQDYSHSLGDQTSAVANGLLSTGPPGAEAVVSNGLALTPASPRSSLDPATTTDETAEAVMLDSDTVMPTLHSPQAIAFRPLLPPGSEPDLNERPLKRKRIAPVNITAIPLHASAVPVPTEADNVLGHASYVLSAESQIDYPWESSNPLAYLGKGSLTGATIKSAVESVSSRMVELDDDQFTIKTTNFLPPGRRLVVYRTMQRLFRENSRMEALLQQGVIPQLSPASEDGETVLSLSDLPDTFDEQTLLEIEAEKLELERFKELQLRQYLEPARVQELVNEAVAGFSAAWELSKLPKYQRKAREIWRSASRGGTKKARILKARQEAKLLDDRIKKLYAGIMDEKWKKEAEVRLQARSLEQTVEDKLHRLWLIELLESRVEPPKLSSLPRTKIPKPTRPSSPFSGEELFSSDDDVSFIVPDDPITDDMDLDPTHDDGASDYNHHHEQGGEKIAKSETPPCVDLTQRTPMKVSGSRPQQRIEIDLTATTPDKFSFAINTTGKQGLQNDEDRNIDLPPSEVFANLEVIGEQSASYWAKKQSRWHLILCLLWKLPHDRRMAILRLVQESAVPDIWSVTVERHIREPLQGIPLGDEHTAAVMAFDMTRIFLSFIKTKHVREPRFAELSDSNKRKLKEQRNQTFPRFCEFISGMAERFPRDDQVLRTEIHDNDLDEENVDDETPFGSQGTPSRPRKNQKKEIIQNKEALDLRERDKKRAEEQKARQANLRAKLSITQSMPSDESRLIINETKEEDQAFIYVNDEIGKRIKDHQIDGVRFLWNQIVLDPEFRQGCLLAHTMGLGKTMQVITLLVAIAETALSPDAATHSQIPDDLRESKTLVLCPAGLVDNWVDEVLLWAPAGLLGDLRKIDNTTEASERFSVVRDWARTGGVLVVGYPMFQKISTADEEVQSILVEAPNIVIADEAHYLKSPEAKISRACSQFRTMSRIALTGSPLANNVEEYHSMIDWVAPNYLGPLSEFRDIYATPIQQGLWGDSSGYEKRRALKMLQVLKETVSPKVHRATIKSCLKNDLPPKFEFVISVAATEMQKRLYGMYVKEVTEKPEKIPQAQLFGIVNDLTLICNHPRSFRHKVMEIRNDVSAQKPVKTFPLESIPAFLKETKVSDLDEPSLSAKVTLLVKILDEARIVGDKVLVFSQSIPTMDYLTNLFTMQKRRFERLDGTTPISRRQDMIKSFNTGIQDVYIISTRAGGIGLNIQGANRVVIFDFKWNPVSDQQAIGRAYRIGQEKTVFVYRFIVAGTFEEDLQNKAVFKMQLASRVVDKANPISWSKRLGSLLHPIKEKASEELSTFAGKDKILDALVGHTNPEVIRSIVSTDTFEEEDVNVVLTTEERKEAETLVNMNRLRVTDPEEYKRLKEKEQREEVARLHFQIPPLASQTALNPANPAPIPAASSSQPPNFQFGLDGAYDSPHYSVERPSDLAEVPGQPNSIIPGIATNGKPPQATPVPLPIVGANTFFSHRPQPNIDPERAVRSEPLSQPERTFQPGGPSQTEQRESSKPRSAIGSIFSGAQSQAKSEFENKLDDSLHAQQETIPSIDPESLTSFAQALASAIEKIRKDKGFGFLPDNQHWRLLGELLSNDRLVQTMLIGQITPGFLALASKVELERRVETLNSLPEEEFHRQLARGLREPEPHNLQNIRRSSQKSPETSRGTRAVEDLKVMREAADNRKSRSSRLPLPAWASEALSNGSSRSPASKGIEDASEDLE